MNSSAIRIFTNAIQKISAFTFLTLFVIGLISCTAKRKTSNYNEYGLYHPGHLLIDYKLLNQPNSDNIFVAVSRSSFMNDALSEEDFLKKYKVEYVITSIKNRHGQLYADSCTSGKLWIARNEPILYFKGSVPMYKLPPFSKLFVKISERTTNKSEVAEAIIDSRKKTNILFFNQSKNYPVIKNYASAGDTLQIMASNSFPLLTGYRIRELYSPAFNPYTFHSFERKKDFNQDSSFILNSGKNVSFSQKGQYYFKPDPKSPEGIFLIVKDLKYPQITHPEDLIEPLIYLLSEKEISELHQKPDPKMALDSFWLSLGGSEGYSSQLIKSYYEKVEFSNKVFTSYKEGWKTDRGMIYIIFGKPDMVFQTGQEEEWIYENILTHIVSFSFIKKEALFLYQDYELVRHPYYEKYWNSAIEKWRSGIITK